MCIKSAAFCPSTKGDTYIAIPVQEQQDVKPWVCEADVVRNGKGRILWDKRDATKRCVEVFENSSRTRVVGIITVSVPMDPIWVKLPTTDTAYQILERYQHAVAGYKGDLSGVIISVPIGESEFLTKSIIQAIRMINAIKEGNKAHPAKKRKLCVDTSIRIRYECDDDDEDYDDVHFEHFEHFREAHHGYDEDEEEADEADDDDPRSPRSPRSPSLPETLGDESDNDEPLTNRIPHLKNRSIARQ
jgi:hypothetical protein